MNNLSSFVPFSIPNATDAFVIPDSFLLSLPPHWHAYFITTPPTIKAGKKRDWLLWLQYLHHYSAVGMVSNIEDTVCANIHGFLWTDHTPYGRSYHSFTIAMDCTQYTQLYMGKTVCAINSNRKWCHWPCLCGCSSPMIFVMCTLTTPTMDGVNPLLQLLHLLDSVPFSSLRM